MAAAVLEAVAVPRTSSGFQKPAAASPRTAIASCISSGRRMELPQFRGLKVHRRAVKSAALPASSGAVRRGRVVCEAQDTAIDERLQSLLMVPDVTTATWQSVVMECDTPVLVEFWAPWCGPCRMILPVISELSKQYAGKLKCLKINTDECPDMATKYGIRSIPTIMIFKKGEKKDQIVGAVPKSTLTASIEKFL